MGKGLNINNNCGNKINNKIVSNIFFIEVKIINVT